MRNYVMVFAALYTSDVIANPTSLFQEAICVGTPEEYEVAVQNLVFNRFPSTWELHSVRFYGDGSSARIYIELDKTYITKLVGYNVQTLSNALNSANVQSKSPKKTWSHGH